MQYSTSHLFALYEQALKQVDLPIGRSFVYDKGDNGLKLIAEMVARAKYLEIASLIKTPSGTNGIATIPSGYYIGGLAIDQHTISLLKDNHYLVILQYEKKLPQPAFYVVVSISEDGEEVSIHKVDVTDGSSSVETVTHLDPKTIEKPLPDVMIKLMNVVITQLGNL